MKKQFIFLSLLITSTVGYSSQSNCDWSDDEPETATHGSPSFHESIRKKDDGFDNVDPAEAKEEGQTIFSYVAQKITDLHISERIQLLAAPNGALNTLLNSDEQCCLKSFLESLGEDRKREMLNTALSQALSLESQDNVMKVVTILSLQSLLDHITPELQDQTFHFLQNNNNRSIEVLPKLQTKTGRETFTTNNSQIQSLKNLIAQIINTQLSGTKATKDNLEEQEDNYLRQQVEESAQRRNVFRQETEQRSKIKDRSEQLAQFFLNQHTFIQTENKQRLTAQETYMSEQSLLKEQFLLSRKEFLQNQFISYLSKKFMSIVQAIHTVAKAPQQKITEEFHARKQIEANEITARQNILAQRQNSLLIAQQKPSQTLKQPGKK